MKNKIIHVTSAIVAILAVSAASADNLTGKVLNCVGPANAFNNLNHTYKFFLDPDQNLTVYFKDAGHARYTNYKLVGAKLTLETPEVSFDISNPELITRSIHDCVNSPYGETSCQEEVQICILK